MNDLLNDVPQPTNVLWVQAGTADGGNGDADSPFNSIQQALKFAKPGTAVMVKAGEYHENVVIPRKVSGEDGAPIWLISADGPQAAHIFAVNPNKAALVGGGTENFVVDGFWITGGKNGIQFSQNGFDYSDMIRNIVVKNNVIDNVVQDGIKLNGGNDVLVTNNVISGGKDEGIDFVGIINGTISHNEVSGNTGTSAAIFAKGGSADIHIVDNYIHNVTGDGISAGGWVNFYRDMREGYTDYQAQNVLIEGNVIEAVGKRPLAFFGAGDVTATNNYLEANPKYYTAVYVGSSNENQYGIHHSHDIRIVDNYLTTETKLLFIKDGSDAVTFENNRAEISIEDAGADISEVSIDREVEKDGSEIGTPSAEFNLVNLDKFLGKDWAESGTASGIGRANPTDGDDLITAKAASLNGGRGDDTYILRDGDGVFEKAGGGIDTLIARAPYAKLTEHVENLTLQNVRGATGIGNEGDNIIRGTKSNDTLIGGGGDNLLYGGGGNDVFLVGESDMLTTIADFNKGDQILISANPFVDFADMQNAMQQVGADTVLALDNDRAIILRGVNGEQLEASDFSFESAGTATKSDSASQKVKAKAATHIAQGSDSADFVYGTGNAILKGGKGNDNYIIKKDGDHIVEFANQGVDTVLLFKQEYVLEANIENVKVRTDENTHITGNNLANTIKGGKGDDIISGGAGADHLDGGLGSDTFVYSRLSDGGDTIDHFDIGSDKLDVSALREKYDDVLFSTQVSEEGLQIYAELEGAAILLATLENVVYPTPLDDLVI